MEADGPDIDFYRLSNTELKEPQNCLFMPLGRLFVNAANGNRFNERPLRNRSRLAMWTGYEVFVADDLGLWIVFDGHSLASHAPLWYPVPCGLMLDLKPGIGCLLSSLSDLEHATFENARSSVETTHQTGFMVLNKVEKSDVKEIEAETIAQDTAHATSRRKPKADVGETPLTSAIKNENEELVKRLLEIGADVNHSNRRGQMPITLAVAKSNVAIVWLLLSTDKVNIDLGFRKHRSLFGYASWIAAESGYTRSPIVDEMADFAAGLEGLSVTLGVIQKGAQEYSSFAVLMLLRDYVKKHNLKFNSHKSRLSFNRPGRLSVDPIRKEEPREQQNMDLSVSKPGTSIVARDRQIA